MLKMLKNNVILILNQDDYYITEKYNGLDELEFSISVNDAYYPQITEEASIIESQRYIIKAIDANTTSATIKCQIDLDDLKSNLYIGYTNYSDTCHNTIHNVLPSGWTVIDLSQSTIRRTVTADAATPLDIINACLDIYGVTVRYDNQSKTVTILDPSKNQPASAFLTSELNLTELNYKGKSSDFATRLYAYGKDDLSFAEINDGKPYVDNNTYSNRIISVYWKDERYTDAESLLADATKKLEGLAIPQRSYSCNVLDLAKTNPDMYGYQNFSLHNVVTLIDIEKNVRVNHSVVEYRRYPYYPEKNIVTLSTVAPKLQNTVKSLQSEIEDPSSDFRTGLQISIDRATGKITGVNGGHVVIGTSADGTPNEILIMDTADKSTAINVIRINAAGIGFSTSGYNGPFRTAWTIDGHFNADYITGGVINGTLIRAGIIQSNDGRVYINLDTGDARFETSGGESMFDAAKDEILEEIADEYETKSDSDAQFAEIRKYIRFEGGNIILGSSGNELILKIQNDKIVFLENEQEIAYWQNRKFYAVDGEFINSLRLGKFAFLPRANGNLSFKRVAD